MAQTKLHWNDVDMMIDMIADRLQEGNLSSAAFSPDNKQILWVDSAECFLLLNFSNNTFKVTNKIYDVIDDISDEAIAECAENCGIIEIDEDGNVVFPNDDEEN